MNFASDNWAGACAPVREALARLDDTIEPAYGGDSLTAAATTKLCTIFETDVQVIFTATGSAANALAMTALGKPAGLLIAHRFAHINADEYGGPERVNPGQKILPLTGHAGKLELDELHHLLAQFPDGASRQGRLSAISITQATELGQVYSLSEIAAIAQRAREHNLGLHMDGARFANALVSLSCTPAEATWKAGIDALSLGFTKNGAWCADLLLLFNRDKTETDYVARQIGHGFSKPRFIAAQVLAMLDNDVWLKNASHANAMAAKLAQGLQHKNWARVPLPPQANAVFAYFKSDDIETLQGNGGRFYPWPDEDIPGELRIEGETLMRLVTNFATTEADIEALLSAG